MSMAFAIDQSEAEAVPVVAGSRSEPQEVQAMRNLWVAVIEQHYRTALSPFKSDQVERRRARVWFETEGFDDVCALAGFEAPEILRRGILRQLAAADAGEAVALAHCRVQAQGAEL
ncbi:hypothetical protein [Pseudoroseicyclus aestuarii]|uniref:Uncharacterized protein n=2 Tax=Pseudoroseicyclus aestuarii TaxID=1795041 RepID=A0A318T465_9RHOB|nr:hypothetical protein [Pseudoroseicyclus aestuarii]PYE81308.1 hypothetical protein DFP88_10799 [Pseudoroseicyclus aestuarii]